MTYIYHYHSPLGGITLSSNGTELTGLWFDGQKYFGDTLEKEYEKKNLLIGLIFILVANLPILHQLFQWKQPHSVKQYGRLCSQSLMEEQ